MSGTKITPRSYKLENNTSKKDIYFSGRNIKTVVYGEEIKQNKIVQSIVEEALTLKVLSLKPTCQQQ